jgi:predicted membrane protein
VTSSDALVSKPLPSAMHFSSLFVALAIMLAGTIYPLVLARSNGSVDHAFVLALFWAMSAGLVRGVGFVPRAFGWKLVFSGWSCAAGLMLAVALRWGA